MLHFCGRDGAKCHQVSSISTGNRSPCIWSSQGFSRPCELSGWTTATYTDTCSSASAERGCSQLQEAFPTILPRLHRRLGGKLSTLICGALLWVGSPSSQAPPQQRSAEQRCSNEQPCTGSPGSCQQGDLQGGPTVLGFSAPLVQPGSGGCMAQLVTRRGAGI